MHKWTNDKRELDSKWIKIKLNKIKNVWTKKKFIATTSLFTFKYIISINNIQFRQIPENTMSFASI